MDRELQQQIKFYNVFREKSKRSSFCFAPTTNLNFHQSGMVNACCYSRSAPLGYYPQQSVSDLLSSPALFEMQESLNRYELRDSCKLCADQVRAGAYSVVYANRYQEKTLKSRHRIRPLTMEFEISNICNLECVMCNGDSSSLIRSRREKRPPLKTPYDDKFVQQLRPYWRKLRKASFLGGEPFLNPLYYKMWEDILDCQSVPNISIASNGTIFDDDVIRVFHKLKPFVVLSLDSLEKKTFEKIRKNADFDLVMKNVKKMTVLSALNGRFLGTNICPMKYNCFELPKMLFKFTEMHIMINFSTVVSPEDATLKNLSHEKLQELILLYKEALIAFENKFPVNLLTMNNKEKWISLISLLSSWCKKKQLESL